jgi:RNA 3'-terminal phosphate cyclase (ATP)
MLRIDGTLGEGGGQVLRTALGLSMVTGTPFVIEGIRAKRERPGLLRQHLTAVQAAARLADAAVTGADPGSQRLTFAPKTFVGGEHTFAVGTAGSVLLVAQAVLPALLTAQGTTRLVLSGGTHNPAAPPFDFLALTFLPLLERLGARARLTLERAGFYPAGGGRVVLEVEGGARLTPFHLLERGESVRRRAVARVAAVPGGVARREVDEVRQLLGWPEDAAVIEMLPADQGPGNALTLELGFEHVTEVVTGFGERGKSAERVAREAVEEVREYLAAGVPVGRHLADQWLIPLALAGGGAFRTLTPTPHTRTNAEVIERFLPVNIAFIDEGEHRTRVEVRPRT